MQVSQCWFPESERMVATGVLAMSLPLGIVLGQGCSPLFVKTGEDVPLMNMVRPERPEQKCLGCLLQVWLGPAVLTLLCCLLFVRSSAPPSPPSRSAQLAAGPARKSFMEYLASLRAVFTNPPFLVLFTVIGGAVGFFNAFSTQVLLNT